MVAIGTDRITKEGNLVSNVPSSSNQMAKRGELFSSEQQPKPLDNTGHGKTFFIQLVIRDGRIPWLRKKVKYTRTSKNWRKE